jgi:pre-mRNA-splicing factor ATP-dependent RNA helicase DHX15/PRP43
VRTAVQIHLCEDQVCVWRKLSRITIAYTYQGDILLFLTGEEEIETACKRVEDECRKVGANRASASGCVRARARDHAHHVSVCRCSVGALVALPLYSTLPPNLQQRIFNPLPVVPGQPQGAHMPHVRSLSHVAS